jgi:hypothetical protein
MVAWKPATVVLQHDHCLTSQNLRGKLSTIADLLSYLGSSHGKPCPLAFYNLSNSQLTQHFHQYLPSQILANFAISTLPNKILSWTAAILQTHKSYVMVNRRPPTSLKIAPGHGLTADPFLSALSQQEIGTVAKSIISCYQTAWWSQRGRHNGHC